MKKSKMPTHYYICAHLGFLDIAENGAQGRLSVDRQPLLAKYRDHTIHEEWHVCHPTYLCSKAFHLRIE